MTDRNICTEFRLEVQKGNASETIRDRQRDRNRDTPMMVNQLENVAVVEEKKM